jgi:hypothetical protein
VLLLECYQTDGGIAPPAEEAMSHQPLRPKSPRC